MASGHGDEVTAARIAVTSPAKRNGLGGFAGGGVSGVRRVTLISLS